MSDTEIKVGDTVHYTGHSIDMVDQTKLKVEAVIPAANMLVASGVNEVGKVLCIMNGIEYFSLAKKSEEEKLQDLLRDVGNDAFCKIMAETIEKHNGLHKQVVSSLQQLNNSGLIMSTGACMHLDNLVSYIGSQLDK